MPGAYINATNEPLVRKSEELLDAPVSVSFNVTLIDDTITCTNQERLEKWPEEEGHT